MQKLSTYESFTREQAFHISQPPKQKLHFDKHEKLMQKLKAIQ